MLVKTMCCLHNCLLSTDNAQYLPTGFADPYANNELRESDWRAMVRNYEPALANPQHLNAVTLRNKLKNKEIICLTRSTLKKGHSAGKTTMLPPVVHLAQLDSTEA